jgi:hypothetical protein
MDDDYEEEGLENEETFGDMKPSKEMKNKITNLSLLDLELKMERLTKPPLQRGFQYFVNIPV